MNYKLVLRYLGWLHSEQRRKGLASRAERFFTSLGEPSGLLAATARGNLPMASEQQMRTVQSNAAAAVLSFARAQRASRRATFLCSFLR